MIRFADVATETMNNVRTVYRGTILRFIYDLRGKPGITIHDERIADIDRGAKNTVWPSRLDDKDIQVEGLFSYEEALISTSVWANIQGITVRFPRLAWKKHYMNRMYGADQGKMQMVVYEQSTGTKVECNTDTDALYAKIVKGYKRYKGKEKKVLAANEVWRVQAANEQKEHEAKGTWGGVQDLQARRHR